MSNLPDVYFGSVNSTPPDLPDNVPDDDELLPETPWEVTALLGFDPLEDEDEGSAMLHEAGVKGMKWGRHKQRLRNPRIGTPKYAGVSKLIDSMLEGNIPLMPDKVYDSYVKGIQTFVEEHPKLLNLAEKAASKMSPQEIEALASGDVDEQQALVRNKYGKAGEAASRVLDKLFNLPMEGESIGKKEPEFDKARTTTDPYQIKMNDKLVDKSGREMYVSVVNKNGVRCYDADTGETIVVHPDNLKDYVHHPDIRAHSKESKKE